MPIFIIVILIDILLFIGKNTVPIGKNECQKFVDFLPINVYNKVKGAKNGIYISGKSCEKVEYE